jgi:histone deacetylase 1/2
MKNSTISIKKWALLIMFLCPHAHQQNDSVEHKHRHIVQVGLALLANVYMPLKFWDEAVLTATLL